MRATAGDCGLGPDTLYMGSLKEEASGGGIVEEAPWRRHRGGGTMEEASWRRLLGGGILEEASTLVERI